MKLEKEIFVKAAKIVTESSSHCRYACNALKSAAGVPFDFKDGYSTSFLDLLMDPSDKLENSPMNGLYGDTHVWQNQLARTLALLLAAEVLGGKDV